MNYITHLNNFFAYAKQDDHLTTSHISLYMALFNHWNFHRFQNPFAIYREDIMRLSKIGSKNTYHKCIKELHRARYITYHPAITKYQPVKIAITILDCPKENPEQLKLFTPQKPFPARPKIGTHTSPEYGTKHVPILTSASPDNGTYTVPKLGHLIKHINNTNNECKHTHSKKMKEEDQIQWKINGPPLNEVEDFFRANNHTHEEAQKFYHYNQSKHWMLTPSIPIMNWQAAAQKWLLNINNQQNAKTNKSNGPIIISHSHPGNNPDYTQPL